MRCNLQPIKIKLWSKKWILFLSSVTLISCLGGCNIEEVELISYEGDIDGTINVDGEETQVDAITEGTIELDCPDGESCEVAVESTVEIDCEGEMDCDTEVQIEGIGEVEIVVKDGDGDEGDEEPAAAITFNFSAYNRVGSALDPGTPIYTYSSCEGSLTELDASVLDESSQYGVEFALSELTEPLGNECDIVFLAYYEATFRWRAVDNHYSSLVANIFRNGYIDAMDRAAAIEFIEASAAELVDVNLEFLR